MTEPIDLLDEASWLYQPNLPEEDHGQLYICLIGQRTVGDLRRVLALARDAERLRAARAYVANNLVVWDDDDGTVVGAAVADVFRKVLNVIDTGNPMTALEGADR